MALYLLTGAFKRGRRRCEEDAVRRLQGALILKAILGQAAACAYLSCCVRADGASAGCGVEGARV